MCALWSEVLPLAYSNTLRVFRKKSGFNREKQFRDVYKLKLKEDQDLISVVHRGMIIVVGKLPGKEVFFDDIIPLDFLDKPEEKSSNKIDVRSVRYKKRNNQFRYIL